jgi:hypothetical protein
MQKNGSTAHLQVHEWLALLIILSSLALLTMISYLTDDGTIPIPRGNTHHVVDPRIEVFVEGAVKTPLRLVVNRGSSVEEILTQVELLPEADIAQLKLQSKVRRGQHIRVPFKKSRKKKKSHPE